MSEFCFFQDLLDSWKVLCPYDYFLGKHACQIKFLGSFSKGQSAIMREIRECEVLFEKSFRKCEKFVFATFFWKRLQKFDLAGIFSQKIVVLGYCRGMITVLVSWKYHCNHGGMILWFSAVLLEPWGSDKGTLGLILLNSFTLVQWYFGAVELWHRRGVIGAFYRISLSTSMSYPASVSSYLGPFSPLWWLRLNLMRLKSYIRENKTTTDGYSSGTSDLFKP